MLRLWVYGKLINYYSFCWRVYHNLYEENKTRASHDMMIHYQDKLIKTYRKRDAYRRYILVRRMD